MEKAVTNAVVSEFMKEIIRPHIKKGYINDRDSLNDAYSDHLYDLVSLKTPGAIIEENDNFHLSGTMIDDQVVGMYNAYDLTFDVAIEILKEKIEAMIKEEDLLEL